MEMTETRPSVVADKPFRAGAIAGLLADLLARSANGTAQRTRGHCLVDERVSATHRPCRHTRLPRHGGAGATPARALEREREDRRRVSRRVAGQATSVTAPPLTAPRGPTVAQLAEDVRLRDPPRPLRRARRPGHSHKQPVRPAQASPHQTLRPAAPHPAQRRGRLASHRVRVSGWGVRLRPSRFSPSRFSMDRDRCGRPGQARSAHTGCPSRREAVLGSAVLATLDGAKWLAHARERPGQ